MNGSPCQTRRKHLPYLSTERQIWFARLLATRHEMNIPDEKVFDKAFCRRFLSLFQYEPENSNFTGFRRIEIIRSYTQTDKEKEHIARKLELPIEDVDFMTQVLAEYRFGGALPRDDENDLDPDQKAYEQMEEDCYKESDEF